MLGVPLGPGLGATVGIKVTRLGAMLGVADGRYDGSVVTSDGERDGDIKGHFVRRVKGEEEGVRLG